MRTLYEASNAVEAHMLADLLGQQGISAQIRGSHLEGAAGGLPAIGLVRLVVDEQDFANARAVIEQWEATEVPRTPIEKKNPPQYRGIKGFALGLLIGIGGMYGTYKIPASVNKIDNEKWTYASNGMPLKFERDRNFDGKVDYVQHYDSSGQIESSEEDNDFNGTFETKTFFRNNSAEFVDMDTDGDGYPDVRIYYKHDVAESIQYINPSTGLPLRVEHLRLGTLLTFADIDSNKDGKLDTRLTYTPLGEVATTQPIAAEAAR